MLCLLLAGCTGTEENTVPEPSGTPGEYEAYASDISGRTQADAWTAAVRSSYVWTYEDETMAIYEMDGTLDAQDTAAEAAGHLREHINANGMPSTMDSYYYGGTLYSTYNDIVSYHEEMPFNEVKKILLIPLEPYALPGEKIADLTIAQDGDRHVYTVIPADDARKDLFLDRYDFYDLGQFSDLDVSSGRITDAFDGEGHFCGETAVFETSFTYKGHMVKVKYESSLTYIGFDTAEVAVTDAMKAEHAGYPAFEDIDTEAIETADVPDDSPESTVEATLRKRLTGRLGYEQISDDVYQQKFNDNEAYTFDFANRTFTYSNYTIDYVYSWRGDVASMGKCTFIFNQENASSDCADTTVEMMKTVRDYMRMELYYCGLSFDDLQKEVNS